MNAFIAVNEQYSYLDILSLHACKGPCREHTRASLGVARGLSTDSRERLLVRVGNFDCVCHGSGGGGWPQTCLKVKQWCMGALHHQSPPMQQLGTPLQVISLAKDLRQMPSP
jgi:hypothetical protein